MSEDTAITNLKFRFPTYEALAKVYLQLTKDYADMKNLYDSALTKIVNLENKIAELENTINNFSENIVSETRDLKVQRDNALAKIKELETEITKLTEQVTYLEIDLKQWV